ncbi:protein kinase [Leptolyngbya sp. NK1-12]|uniref:Protein kinase n=1 Tax=Leptolyngbya sp. NK1-12 TaxID=2547451 RepID=A0AA96WI55_9CYAN|nr:serine/threonine-protein kinase [Leptolyngbya sp. NK1-12]WNZ21761.1 protein kinase [Leptolyngbya sp. NK1-12]
MSLCINPHCPQSDHPGNDGSQFCRSCGSDLLLLGRYRVMRLLSDKSGFGRVYEAFDRSTPKILKILKEHYSHHVKAVELFRQEAIVLGQLPHPGIPAIEPQSYFEFYPKGSSEPLHCIIMEKIEGPNLKEWMQQQGNNPISEKQALNWLKQLAEILHLVHGKNYFHRDIKPENIMLRANGQLVLVDFGAAREMTYTYLAQMGNTGGTRISSAGYTPPEQEKGRAVPQSDFYALGYTLIYLLTGKPPTDPDMYDSLHNELRWHRFAPQVSPALAYVIDRLIAPQASARPQNTEELLQMLARVEKAQSEKKPASPQAVVSTLVQDQARLGSTHLGPVGLRSRRWLWGGALALLLVAGGYTLWQLKPEHFLQATRTEQATMLKTLEGHAGTVRCLTFTPDGQRLITGSNDQTIKVWNVDTGQLLFTLTGHTSAIRSLTVKSDGSTLVSGSDDQTIKLWNLGNGQEIGTLKGHTSYLNAVAISPDGRLLASASADQTMRLWDLSTKQELRLFSGHSSYVNSVVFSPDGKLLASASADRTIKLWAVATGELLRTLEGHSSYVNAIVFTPDGANLITASADQTIRVWNAATGAEERLLKGHISFVEDIAISPDGQYLLSGSADQTLKLWDLRTGNLLRSLTGFNAHIKQFTPSPNWQSVAVAVETTVKIAQLPRRAN